MQARRAPQLRLTCRWKLAGVPQASLPATTLAGPTLTPVWDFLRAPLLALLASSSREALLGPTYGEEGRCWSVRSL
jgi:hypothetical protein